MAETKPSFIQNALDFIKKNFFIIAAIFVFFIWWNGCGGNVGQGRNTSDTTTHTVQQPQPIIIMPPYQPQQSGNTVFPINIPQQYNPSSDLAKLTEQYTKLANEFLAVRNYRDSITLKDSSGNRVGVVNLEQMVSENMLKSTKPSYQLNFPHTFTTITNTVYPKIRNQIFFGASVESPISGAESVQANLGILLKNKKENIYQLSVGYDFGTKKPAIEIGYYFKIQFKPLIPRIL